MWWEGEGLGGGGRFSVTSHTGRVHSIHCHENAAHFESVMVVCREFLEPMLLVTLFAPASQLSAAAALAALYYFVLAHQVQFTGFVVPSCA